MNVLLNVVPFFIGKPCQRQRDVPPLLFSLEPPAGHRAAIIRLHLLSSLPSAPCSNPDPRSENRLANVVVPRSLADRAETRNYKESGRDEAHPRDTDRKIARDQSPLIGAIQAGSNHSIRVHVRSWAARLRNGSLYSPLARYSAEKYRPATSLSRGPVFQLHVSPSTRHGAAGRCTPSRCR